MKRALIVVLMGIGCMAPGGAVAYHKFCYANYQYPVKEKAYKAPFAAMEKAMPFGVKNANYVYSSHNGTMRCYVHLTERDKKRVYKRLAQYQPETPITNEMIQLSLNKRRTRAQIVGWVLQDFVKFNKNATVAQVLAALD